LSRASLARELDRAGAALLETMFAAELWGVDAFDQPAVEESKIITRQYLSARR
jgi:glucose-6-phosphate isomerase